VAMARDNAISCRIDSEKRFFILERSNLLAVLVYLNYKTKDSRLIDVNAETSRVVEM
jgi:hypothetical protein